MSEYSYECVKCGGVITVKGRLPESEALDGAYVGTNPHFTAEDGFPCSLAHFWRVWGSPPMVNNAPGLTRAGRKSDTRKRRTLGDVKKEGWRNPNE